MADEPNVPDRQATVFLSYSRVDRQVAERLADTLKLAGITVWWDALIEGGAAFAKSIATALDEADAVIVLWSTSSAESDWVRDEAAAGRDRHRLVPVSIDGTIAPLGFRQYQSIDLTRWHGKRDAPEINAILSAVDLASHKPVPLRPVMAPVSRRSAIGIGAGAAVLIVGGGGLVGWKTGLFDRGEAANSIAILPFRNLSPDPEQAFFSQGLTEELRSALSRNDSLKVIAGASSDAAGAAGASPADFARKFQVAFILDGTVRRSGDTVRITANLSDGATGFSRWSKTFDRGLADIFAVQSEIAGLVAQAMAAQIESAAPAPGGTRIVAAYEAYLRGRALFNTAKDEVTDRAALDQYGQAIALDPGFALAYAARSRSLAAIAGEYGKADQLRSLYDAAIASARQAVDLAPDLAEAQLALGFALFTGRLDVRAARAPYERAYALGHGDADILLLFAIYAVRAGRGTDALAAIRRAQALDPLNPRTHRAAGSIHYALRQYPTAIAALDQSLALNPKISNASAMIGNCRYQLGQVEAARAAYAAEPHDVFRLSGLAIAEHRLGHRAKADVAMAALVALGDSALYQQAEVLAQWDERDRAIAALQRARAIGDAGLLYLTTDPMLDPVKETPQFKALASRIGLI